MPIVGSSGQQSGTGYTNLSKLIGANQAGPSMGQAIAGNVQKAGQSAQEAYDKEKQEFRGAVDKATDKLNEGKKQVLGQGGLLENATSGKINPASIGEAVSNLNAYTANYSGPRGLSGQGQGAASKAVSMGKASTGELLQGQYGRQAGYNPNLRRFDQALLGRDQNLQNIKQAQAGVMGAGEQYNRLAGYALGRGQQMAAETQGFQTEVGKKLRESNLKVESDIDKQFKDTQAQMDADVKALKDRISAGTVDENDMLKLKSMGLDPNMLTGTATKEDVLAAITSRANDITKQNVMTREQANALRALKGLQGKGYQAADVGITDDAQVGQQGAIGSINSGLLSTSKASADEAKKIEADYATHLASNQKSYQDQTKAMQDTENRANILSQNLGTNDLNTLSERLKNDPEFKAKIWAQYPEVVSSNFATNAEDGRDTETRVASQLIQNLGSLQGEVNRWNVVRGQTADQYRSTYGEAKNALSPYATTGGSYKNLANLLGYTGKYTPQQYLSGYGEAGPMSDTVSTGGFQATPLVR